MTWKLTKKNILWLVITLIVIAGLAIYSEWTRYTSFRSLNAGQKVASYSLRTNRYMMVHLTSGKWVDLDLIANHLRVTVGRDDSLHKQRLDGNGSRYVLTLTPKELITFREKFVNCYGADAQLMQTEQHSTVAVHVSL